MIQLPAGATGFFEAGTFREPIQRGDSYSWSISWPERAGAPWKKQTLHYAGKTFMPHKSSETVEQKFCS